MCERLHGAAPLVIEAVLCPHFCRRRAARRAEPAATSVAEAAGSTKCIRHPAVSIAPASANGPADADLYPNGGAASAVGEATDVGTITSHHTGSGDAAAAVGAAGRQGVFSIAATAAAAAAPIGHHECCCPGEPAAVGGGAAAGGLTAACVGAAAPCTAVNTCSSSSSCRIIGANQQSGDNTERLARCCSQAVFIVW